MPVRVLAVVAFGLLAACSDSTVPPTASPTLTEGDPAPRFELPATNGTTVSLEDFAGKPVLLYFSMGPG